jgi:hypothetical protein
MIGLLPIGRVIALTSVVYAIFVALAVACSWRFGAHSQTILGSVGFAFAGATALQLGLMGWFYFGWRQLWRWMPIMNRILFPDIGGEWRIEIHWHRYGQDGVVDAEATIRQDFLKVSMEVRSPNSDSQTLMAQPKKDPESGRPLLYYVYLVNPKKAGADSGRPYYGAAILKFSEAGGGNLSGNYWTTQESVGQFRLLHRKGISR